MKEKYKYWFIGILIVAGLIIWFLLQPSGNTSIPDESCQPDYVGGCW